MMRPGVARATGTLLRNAAASVRGRVKLQVSIDNLDGSGAHDYSDCVLPDAAVRIERGLNVPSRCTFDVLVTDGGLPLPARRARVRVSDNGGGVLFTGYLATEPVRANAGGCGNSEASRAKVNAVSDEWLLDKLGPAALHGNGLSLGLNAREVLQSLMQRVGSAALSFSDSGGTAQTLGALRLADDASWSANAGQAAAAGYAAYRVLNGAVFVPSAGTTVHALSDSDGTLAIADFQTSQLRELANDVTVSGDLEPTTYATDVMVGDGLATEFALTEPAFYEAHPVLLQDSFAESAVDTKQWLLNDPGSHLSITSAGLTMNGGNGVDGATALTALDAIEMGGSLLVELRGVRLNANSDGMLAGMYAGATVLASCFAGFRVRQNSGSTALVPVVSGAEVGTPYIAVAGHSYTLRLRLHCVETQRVMQRYACMVDGVVQTFGSGSAVSAPMDVVFDLVDEGEASNNPATVLYDSAASGGAVTLTPATCAFVAVNSRQLYGSVASVNVTRAGTLWVVSTLPSGTKQTRLIGSANEGVDCSVAAGSAVSGPGKMRFFAGRVPVAGELINVSYRTSGRSIARAIDATSVAAEVAAGVAGTSRWLGKVLQPPARSSADCESASQAILAFATSRSAAVAGTYTFVNPTDDVWPGDLLQVTTAGVMTPLLVRSVVIEDQPALREATLYKIGFANDWATELRDGLGLKLSEAIASDALLPHGASDGSEVLGNLGALQVVSVSESALSIDAGVDPLTGGGFEVRRRDGGFGATSDVDLVLRSPVRTFSIPREAQVERYYVRAYDTSVPPKYSRFSSAVFVNVPVG